LPVNHRVCLKYKDTWAAPGSKLYDALQDRDYKKAEAIYKECEREYQRHRVTAERIVSPGGRD
jgi:hypothetical protein